MFFICKDVYLNRFRIFDTDSAISDAFSTAVLALLELLEYVAEVDFLGDDCMQILNLDTLLLH